MNTYLPFETYSIGTGDRFAHQAGAQLAAVELAEKDGVRLSIVWNKSNREHKTIGSTPEQTFLAGSQAAAKAGRTKGFYFDADHINLSTVDAFIPYCNFFTLDVADEIGKPADTQSVTDFLHAAAPYIDKDLEIEGMSEPLRITHQRAVAVAGGFLAAAQAAGAIYRKIASKKDPGSFVTEVSMDEVDTPQGPEDILLILLAIAREGIPVQTFAPRFSGRFNKGVDYVGDAATFRAEFEADMLVLRWAAEEFGLPPTLKLSVHSGSDKFAIYPAIRECLKKHGLGVHLKTAGTTWLEEIIGLAEAGGSGLQIAKDVYRACYDRIEELAVPYASVIDIDPAALPAPAAVDALSGDEMARSIRHDQSDPLYNPSMRQLMHVGYKVAAEMGQTFIGALEEHEAVIGKHVTGNLWERHIKRIFL